ncbi:glycosyltransferase [Myxococcota bacterium]|nr:glycosyltransferase [Myxococcota bacterium]
MSPGAAAVAARLSLVHEPPEADPSPAIGVVVPVRDGGERLRGLLAALGRQRGIGPVEVLVVDSGSRDGSVAAARGAGARVFALDGEPFHHARVRNAAIARSRAPLVAMLTQDAVPRGETFLADLAAAVLRDDRVAGSYGRQVPRPGADPYSQAEIARWTPDGPPEVRVAPSPGALGALSPAERYALCRFDDVASCVRRADWERVPLPDVPFGEDVAWAAEVLAAGRAIAYAPAAVVEHSHEPGFRALRARNRAGHRLLAERFGLVAVPGLASIPPAWLSGLAPSAALAARARPGAPAAAARLWVRRSWHDLGTLIGQWEGARDARAGPGRFG